MLPFRSATMPFSGLYPFFLPVIGLLKPTLKLVSAYAVLLNPSMAIKRRSIHMLLSPSPWLHFFFFNALTSWYAHPTGRLIPQSSGLSATETTANSSIYLKIRDEKDYFSGCQVFGSPESRPSGEVMKELCLFWDK